EKKKAQHHEKRCAFNEIICHRSPN
ncbi:hypothetical protein VCHENC02_1357B, partial [Vibrio harveyi]